MLNEAAFQLSDLDRKILQYDLLAEEIDQDMIRRAAINPEAPYEKLDICKQRVLRNELPKLRERLFQKGEVCPDGEDEILKLIFANPEYKNRSQRDEVVAAELAAQAAEAAVQRAAGEAEAAAVQKRIIEDAVKTVVEAALSAQG